MVCLTELRERDKKNISRLELASFRETLPLTGLEFVENHNGLEEVGAMPTLSRNGEVVRHLAR